MTPANPRPNGCDAPRPAELLANPTVPPGAASPAPTPSGTSSSAAVPARNRPAPGPIRLRFVRAAEVAALSDWVAEQGRLAYHVRNQLGPHEFYATQTWVERTHAGRRKVFEDPASVSIVATVPRRGQDEGNDDEEEEGDAHYTPDGKERFVGLVEFGPMRYYSDMKRYEEPRWELYTLYSDPCMAGTGLGKQLVGEAMLRMMPVSGDDQVALEEGDKPLPTARMQEGDGCAVLTLQQNPARGFYAKLGGREIYQLPNYPYGLDDKTTWVVGFHFDWPTMQSLAAHARARGAKEARA